MGRRKRGERVLGPYRDGAGWRVVLYFEDRREDYYFATRAEAERAKAEGRGRLCTESGTVAEALEAFMRSRAKLREKSRTTLRHRLQAILGALLDEPVLSIGGEEVSDAVAGRGAKNRRETVRNEIAVARQMWAWCIRKNLVRRNPWEGIEAIGAEPRKKETLTIDEARKLVNLCLARPGKPEVVALTMVLMGCRVSEIVEREVRDLDDEGRLLRIPTAKTSAGVRQLEVPEVLRGLLQAMAGRRAGAEPLVGETRYWAAYHVDRLCAEAGVPLVGCHGLRRTHATAARQAGATGELVARAMGHSSETVTERHYLAAGTKEAATTRRALRAIQGGKAGR